MHFLSESLTRNNYFELHPCYRVTVCTVRTVRISPPGGVLCV